MLLEQKSLDQIAQILDQKLDEKLNLKPGETFDQKLDRKFDEKLNLKPGETFDQKLDRKFDEKFEYSVASEPLNPLQRAIHSER